MPVSGMVAGNRKDWDEGAETFGPPTSGSAAFWGSAKRVWILTFGSGRGLGCGSLFRFRIEGVDFALQQFQVVTQATIGLS